MSSPGPIGVPSQSGETPPPTFPNCSPGGLYDGSDGCCCNGEDCVCQSVGQFACSVANLANAGADPSFCYYDDSVGGRVFDWPMIREECANIEADTDAEISGGCQDQNGLCPIKWNILCANPVGPAPSYWYGCAPEGPFPPCDEPNADNDPLCQVGFLNPISGRYCRPTVPAFVCPSGMTYSPLQEKCIGTSCPVCTIDDGDGNCVVDPLCVVTPPPPPTCPTTLDCDGVTPYQETATPCGQNQRLDKASGCCAPCCCAVNQVIV